MIDLYYFPGSAALAVHAALEEAGADYNLIRATRENGVFGPPEAARLNPAGRSPTMSFDGLPMSESVACLMHVADLYPAAGLAPSAGTQDRARYYRWLSFLLNPVQSTFYAVIFPGRHAPPEAQPAVTAHAKGLLDQHRTRLEEHLTTEGPYLLGETLCAADLFLFMLTRWGRRLEPRWWDVPALGEHYRTIKARPAIQRVFEQEGLEDAI